MGVVILGGSCPSIRGTCTLGRLFHRGNGPRGVVALVASNQRGSSPGGYMSRGVVSSGVVVPGIVVP